MGSTIESFIAPVLDVVATAFGQPELIPLINGVVSMSEGLAEGKPIGTSLLGGAESAAISGAAQIAGEGLDQLINSEDVSSNIIGQSTVKDGIATTIDPSSGATISIDTSTGAGQTMAPTWGGMTTIPGAAGGAVDSSGLIQGLKGGLKGAQSMGNTGQSIASLINGLSSSGSSNSSYGTNVLSTATTGTPDTNAGSFGDQMQYDQVDAVKKRFANMGMTGSKQEQDALNNIYKGYVG